MPDSMIERVARALWDHSLLKPYHIADVNPSMTYQPGEPDWQRFIPVARAVIAVMREPTEDMKHAGIRADPNKVGLLPPIHAWPSMIDAALAER